MTYIDPERGPAARQSPEDLLAALALPTWGSTYEDAIYLFESVYLEEISRERVHEFLFVAMPLKIEGVTGSMLDPVAIV